MREKIKNQFQEYVNSEERATKSLIPNGLYYLMYTIFLICVTFQIGTAQITTYNIKRDSTEDVGLKPVKFKAGTDITIKDKKSDITGAQSKYHGWLGDKWKDTETEAYNDAYEHRTLMPVERYNIQVVTRQH